MSDTSPGADPAARRVTAVATTPADLAAVRRLALRVATLAGIDDDRAGELAVAISEVVTNAITHGAPPATVTMAVTEAVLLITVHDQGTIPLHHADIRTRLRQVEPPLPERLNGRGLWLAAQLCDRVDAHAGADGTTITLAMDL